MGRFLDNHKNRFVFLLLTLSIFWPGTGVALAHNPHDIIDALAISPNYAQDQTVFIAVSVEGLFKSTDGGYSWKELVNGLDNKGPLAAIAISPAFQADRTVFVAAEGDGVFRSQDGGASWVKVNQGLDHLSVFLLAISPNYERDQTLLAADSQGGLYRTRDGGANWRRVLDNGGQIRAIGFGPDEGSGLVLAGDHTGALVLSQDGGETWQTGFEFSRSGAITAIAVSPAVAQDGTVFVGTEKAGIFKSSDGARSFEHISTGLEQSRLVRTSKSGISQPVSPSIQSLVVSPAYETDQTLFASSWDAAVYQSHDGGQSWDLFSRGLTTDSQADTAQYYSPHFRNLRISSTFEQDKTLFLEGYDGLFKSTDGGRAWTQLETLNVRFVMGLGVSPGDKDSSTLAITTAGGGPYILPAAASTWLVNNRGLNRTDLVDIVFSPNYQADHTIFSVLGNSEFVYVTDWNQPWQRVRLSPDSLAERLTKSVLRRLGLPTPGFLKEPPTFPDMVAMSPDFDADDTIYLGTRYDGVYRSLDGGATWSDIWPGRQISSMVVSPDFSADRTVFASTRNDGVYKTVDAGQTWRPVNDGLASTLSSIRQGESSFTIDLTRQDIQLIISPDYQHDQTVFAGSVGGLFKSTNGGERWQELTGSSGDGPPYIISLAISPDYGQDQTLLVSAKGRGLFKSVDGGLSFGETGSELLENNYNMELLEFSPGYATDQTIYGASDEHVFRSTDGGQHWELLPRSIRYEDDREVIRYQGGWDNRDGDEFSATGVTYSDVAGHQASLNFVGTGIAWIGTTAPDQGMASVFIDGQAQGQVDQFSDEGETMVTSFAITDLAYGPHTITIEVAESRNPAATGSRITIDAFDIWP